MRLAATEFRLEDIGIDPLPSFIKNFRGEGAILLVLVLIAELDEVFYLRHTRVSVLNHLDCAWQWGRCV